MCFAVFIGYNIFLRISNSSRYAVAAYQTGDKVEILLDNDKSFEISGVVDAKLSKGGNVKADYNGENITFIYEKC